jgi:hypothetical protein
MRGSAAGSYASSHHGSLEGSEEDEEESNSDDYPENGYNSEGGGSSVGTSFSINPTSLPDSIATSRTGASRMTEFPDDDDDDLL